MIAIEYMTLLIFRLSRYNRLPLSLPLSFRATFLFHFLSSIYHMIYSYLLQEHAEEAWIRHINLKLERSFAQNLHNRFLS